ncbi:hypothetical protein LYNGBM3L_66120 [Moorena producens 3L]|uniref:Uncharacterized protein n=1 Tax=Moorena producens 3L TaxID=489825 RepID=F4Y1C4_9CYAN|nr:hypothetical protein LYNGBM3L_66120 [Moorena producens 3L]
MNSKSLNFIMKIKQQAKVVAEQIISK